LIIYSRSYVDFVDCYNIIRRFPTMIFCNICLGYLYVLCVLMAWYECNSNDYYIAISVFSMKHYFKIYLQKVVSCKTVNTFIDKSLITNKMFSHYMSHSFCPCVHSRFLFGAFLVLLGCVRGQRPVNVAFALLIFILVIWLVSLTNYWSVNN
jgi:4-hydroxybenzoate polyprenyltransferase